MGGKRKSLIADDIAELFSTAPNTGVHHTSSTVVLEQRAIGVRNGNELCRRPDGLSFCALLRALERKLMLLQTVSRLTPHH